MYSDKTFHSPLRRYALLGIFLYFILLILSCKSGEQRSVSVGSAQKNYEQETVLLGKINKLNEQGKYAEAIPQAERLCMIFEEKRIPEYQELGVCLNVLGGLYNSFGDYEKAEIRLKRAYEILKKSEEKDELLTAHSLGILGKVYMNKGQFREAEAAILEALKIREQNKKRDLYMVSTSLNTLGEIYLHLHEYNKAETVLLRALKLRKQHGNKPGLVVTYNTLCRVYYDSGDYKPAELMGNDALELGENSIGESHPHLAETLNTLGRVAAAQGRYHQAFQYMKQAQNIDFTTFDYMKGFTSEVQKLKFIQKIQENLQVFLTLILKKLHDSPEALKEGMDTVLKRKGIILEVQKQFQKAILSGDKETIRIFNRLSDVRSHLTKMAFSEPKQNNLDAYLKKMDLLRAKKERLEIQLRSNSQSYSAHKNKIDANCELVATSLEKNGKGALVELVKVRLYNFDNHTERKWDGDHYFAFILMTGNPYDLREVDLGEAAYVDSLIIQLKREIKQYGQNKKKITLLASRLYNTIFLPIEKELGGQRNIYLSPDGTLNLIPFEIFYNPNRGFLIEDYTFNYVSSGRDLLGFGKDKNEGKDPLLLGDPDFDAESSDRASGSEQSVASELSQEKMAQRSLLMKELHFDRLPGTREEVLAIQSILGKDQTKLYTGKAATEKVLRTMKTPRVLHLATHGFFLKDIESESKKSPSVQRIKNENPLLRCGFALSGANNSIKSNETRLSDGIVTAEKILGLNLRGTGLVVLSACNTGVGVIKTGEGVFGLRRAFIQTGVRSLIMSMWSVSDQETKELMVELYKNLVFKKMNRCQALREAMLKEMKTVKKRYGYSNPFFWGAFIFMGEP